MYKFWSQNCFESIFTPKFFLVYWSNFYTKIVFNQVLHPKLVFFLSFLQHNWFWSTFTPKLFRINFGILKLIGSKFPPKKFILIIFASKLVFIILHQNCSITVFTSKTAFDSIFTAKWFQINFYVKTNLVPFWH